MYYRPKLKSLAVFVTIFLTLFSVVAMALPQPVSAAAEGSFIDSTTLTEVKDRQKYYWLRNCFFHYDINRAPKAEVARWDFFEGIDDGYEIVGNVYGPNEEATWGCEEEDNVRTAFKAIGQEKPFEAFCQLDGAQYPGGTCTNSQGNGDWDNNASKEELGKSFEKLAAASAPDVVRPITDVQNYVRYYLSLDNQCGGESGMSIQSGDYQEGSADDDDAYQIPVVNFEKKEIQYRLGLGLPSGGATVAIVATKTGTVYKEGEGASRGRGGPVGEVITCNETANRLRSYAQAYQTFLNNNEGKLTEATNTSGGTKPKETCESKGGALSWFLCPVMYILDGGIFALTTAIESMLSIEFSKYNDPSVVQAWQVMRNIALLILIPMMLLMVIGTALEFGPFDAYTVKKALPRMVLAVLFITLSRPITEFLVNLSNIFGFGIQGILLSASGTSESLADMYTRSEGALLSGLVIAGIGIAGAAGAITLGILLSFALVAFVTLLVAYAVLLFRELLILILIIIAPLAILVWIFPANDGLWKIWKTTFGTLLLMFPIIILIITSGQVFAGIVGETQNVFVGSISKLILIVGCFAAVPLTFRWGFGFFGNVVGMVNDRSRGFFDKQRKFREGSRAQATARARAGQRFAGGTSNNWRGKMNRGIGGALNAPSAIMSTGSLLPTPGNVRNWGAATRAQMGNNNLAEVERNMKENPHYQSWMYNDDLNRLATESRSATELRTNMINAKDKNGNPQYSARDIDDSVNRVEAVRRTMDPNAFRIMTTRQAIAGGTAYKTEGDHDDAGRVMAAIATASGSDAAAMQYLIANGRSEGMKSGRVDYAGASFGETMGVVDELRGRVMKGERISGSDLSDEASAAVSDASHRIRTMVYGNQGGAALVHSSMKPQAVKDMAPIMLEQVRASTGNDVQFAETLASMAAIYDGMAGSSPKRAKVIADEVLGQTVDVSSLSSEMQAAMASYGQLDGSGRITIQKAIEIVRQQGSPGNKDFLEMRREYNSLIAQASAEQNARNAPDNPVGGNPTAPPR